MQHPNKVKKKRCRLTRRLALLLMGIFVALAVAFVFLLPAIKIWFPSSKYPPPTINLTFRSLSVGNAAALESIQVSHLAGDEYTLQAKDGRLFLARDGALLAISKFYEDDLLKAATQITVQDTVTEDVTEVAEHLADMGLEPPQTTVTARYTDGHVDILSIGAEVPETTYSYYRWSGASGVYMCDIGIAETFALTQNRLLPVTQPIIAKTLIDRVSLRMKGGTPIEMSFAADSSGLVSGALRLPYTYPMSADATSTMLTALENFRLGTSEAEVSDENRAAYGFDDPLCVVELHQNAGSRSSINEEGQLVAELLDEQALRFTLGRTEGDYFYTCEYEGSCYLVSRFLVETLVNADASKLTTKNPADLGDALLSAITVQTGAGAIEVRITRTERILPNNQLETDENGMLVYDTSATLNGEALTPDQLGAFVTRLRSMTIAGDVSSEWTPAGETPHWQMTLTTQGGTTRTIAAYPMDAFSDALVVDGVLKHYVHVEALDMALAEWMPK